MKVKLIQLIDLTSGLLKFFLLAVVLCVLGYGFYLAFQKSSIKIAAGTILTAGMCLMYGSYLFQTAISNVTFKKIYPFSFFCLSGLLWHIVFIGFYGWALIKGYEMALRPIHLIIYGFSIIIAVRDVKRYYHYYMHHFS